ncbi:MAG: hypothetical protein GY749_40250 [Desulfobacteraceae bacterium]|nr:hypothetical protein [Desulfobacteraceae bacterium]
MKINVGKIRNIHIAQEFAAMLADEDDNGKEARINARIPATLKEVTDKFCRLNNCSLSDALRMALILLFIAAPYHREIITEIGTIKKIIAKKYGLPAGL